MEILHPWVIRIGIVAVVALLVALYFIKKKTKYTGGIKAANTSFVKGLDLYKSRASLYKVLSVIMVICILSSLFASVFLLARPAKKETVNNGIKKRDIFLCMDVSYSLYDLNYDLVESLEGVVAGLDGDRFGICIFNTTTVLYVPMTDDYDFINTKLEEIKEYFRLQKEYMDTYYDPSSGLITYDPNDMDAFTELQEKLDYYDAGTLVNNYRKGSSLIGEGLSSCMYSFPRLDDEDRTRIIILSTDNAQEARMNPIVELKESAQICKKNKIKVFGIFPNVANWSSMNTTDYATDEAQLKSAVEETGGKFYKESESLSVDDIVNDIEREEALEVEEVTITKMNDQPQIPVIVLIISLSLMFVIGLVIRT